MTYLTTGIPLGWRPYREVDRLYSLFTEEHGLIDVIARGSQKVLAKVSPHTEHPAECLFFLAKGRQMDTLAGVERLETFLEIHEDQVRSLLMQNGLAFVSMGTRQLSPDPILYQEVLAWLRFLNALPCGISSERAAYLLASFGLKVLSILGFRPQLESCIVCQKRLAVGELYWHAVRGGTICESCVRADQATYFAARPIPTGVLKLLRFALSERFSDQLRLSLPGEELRVFYETVDGFFLCHFPVIPGQGMREACVF